jgi:hypothetical protein
VRNLYTRPAFSHWHTMPWTSIARLCLSIRPYRIRRSSKFLLLTNWICSLSNLPNSTDLYRLVNVYWSTHEGLWWRRSINHCKSDRPFLNRTPLRKKHRVRPRLFKPQWNKSPLRLLPRLLMDRIKSGHQEIGASFIVDSHFPSVTYPACLCHRKITFISIRT